MSPEYQHIRFRVDDRVARITFARPPLNVFNIAMMRESLDVFERFAETVGVPGLDVSFRQQGYLFLSQTEDGAARIAERVARQRAAGLDDVT